MFSQQVPLIHLDIDSNWRCLSLEVTFNVFWKASLEKEKKIFKNQTSFIILWKKFISLLGLKKKIFLSFYLG